LLRPRLPPPPPHAAPPLRRVALRNRVLHPHWSHPIIIITHLKPPARSCTQSNIFIVAQIIPPDTYFDTFMRLYQLQPGVAHASRPLKGGARTADRARDGLLPCMLPPTPDFSSLSQEGAQEPKPACSIGPIP
jgi:hypothetical protein